MQHNLCRTTDHDASASKLFFQPIVEPFQGTSIVIPLALCGLKGKQIEVKRIQTIKIDLESSLKQNHFKSTSFSSCNYTAMPCYKLIKDEGICQN